MKNSFRIGCLLLIFTASLKSYSQNVGINSTGAVPDASAALDVVSTDKGILVPRMTSAQRGLIAAPVKGLLVFDNTTSSFWYHNGTLWVENDPTGASSGWTLTGNTGTTSGTNFIGTTDAQDVDIRTNNVIRVRITQNGQIEVLNTGNSVFIGEGAGANDDLSNNVNVFVGSQAGAANTTGDRNTATGYQSLLTNNTGNQNTANGAYTLSANTFGTSNSAFGAFSLNSSTTGGQNNAYGTNSLQFNVGGANNAAFGSVALQFNTAGNYNAALGNYALRASLGSNNSAVGFRAGDFNSTGSDNTFIGYESDATVNNLTNATAIGANAVVSQSNSLILGNNANVGIGTSAPAFKLDVVGNSAGNDGISVQNTGGGNSQIRFTNGAVQKHAMTLDQANDKMYYWNAAAGNYMTVDGTDIGIGTNAPTDKLHIVGTSGNTLRIEDGNEAAGRVLTSDVNGNASWAVAGGADGDGIYDGNGTTPSNTAVTVTDNINFDANTLYIDGTNNRIGIGTTSPFGALHVNGDVGAGSWIYLNGNIGGAPNPSGQGRGLMYGWNASSGQGEGDLLYGTQIGGANHLYLGTWNGTIKTRRFVFTNNGNFGVGELNPSAKLDVIGTTELNGAVAIVDGTQGAGKVLTSDASGNASWVAPAGGSGWETTGNAGTVDGTNFIGTTDDVPLTIKVNNVKSGYISNSGFGNGNTALGYGVMQGTTSASSNVAIGNRVMFTGNGGNSNVGVGYQALQAVDNDGMFNSGDQNTALGSYTLMALTYGDNNVAIGNVAGTKITTGSSNTLVGQGAGRENTTTTRNTVIGAQADYNNQTGSQNVLIGYGAGQGTGLHSKSGNVRIGYQAGQNDNTDNKLYIDNSNSVTPLIYGDFATNLLRVNGTMAIVDGTQGTGKILTSDASGNASWVAPAGGSGWGLTGDAGTVDGTNFIGTTDNIPLNFRVNNIEAGRIDNINNNTFLGVYSGENMTTGLNNVAVGHQALRLDVGGHNNTAVGYTAAYATTGEYNTALGQAALVNNGVGTNNTALGQAAGFSSSTGIQNTFVGSRAGDLSTTGSNNLFVGYLTNPSVGTLTNASAIGHRAYVGASNSMVLGSINGVNGATSDVNVGIGTTVPTDKLHVVGTSGNTLRIVDGNQAAGRVLTSAADGSASWQSTTAQEAWIAPALSNGWQNRGFGFSNVGYYKDNDGLVHLRGLVDDGTSDILFTLPVGYRPAQHKIFSAWSYDNVTLVAKAIRLQVDATGEVRIYNTDFGIGSWASIEGVSFRTD